MAHMVKNPDQFAQRIRQLHELQTMNPDITKLTECDVIQSVSQTELWVCCSTEEGGLAVAQAKLAAHELEIEQYPAERKTMRGGEAGKLARRWGRELPSDHPAYREVHALAVGLGTAPRRGFLVVELTPSLATSIKSASNGAVPGTADDAIIGAIARLVSVLSPAALHKVREILAHS
jgi:hypothetical protein